MKEVSLQFDVPSNRPVYKKEVKTSGHEIRLKDLPLSMIIHAFDKCHKEN